ncbi:mucin-20 [Talpa occidentalis]|uniref:mucin-20 n=1 Tax=Talpa occidentalis TaxID=50954 RepID=UPI0023F984D2|nr:mucin-20 [Talpa occidentalis]
MGSLWGLALPLFFFFWVPGAPKSFAGHRTKQPSPLVTVNHIEVLAVTPGIGTSSEGDFQTTDLTEISSPRLTPLETQTISTRMSVRNLILAGTFSEAKTRDPKTIFPAIETKALTKITPSKFKVVIPTSMATSVTSGTGTAMTTVEMVKGSHLSEDVFDILCTDDSSEEVKRITTDVLTLAYTSAETETLPWKSSPYPESTAPAIPTSQALAPDTTAPAKALIAYNITDTKVINCSIIEIETTAIPETSDTDHSPEEKGKTPSTPETFAMSDSTEVKSYRTRTTATVKHSSIDSTTESAASDTTVETPLTANSTTERETTAAKTITPSGTLMTGSMNLEETSGPSVETTSHSKFSISTEAGSASPVESSATVYSPSKVATIKNSTPSQTSTTDSTTAGLSPSTRSPGPYVYLTTIKGSQETNSTLAKTRGSEGTSKTDTMAPGKTPAILPTSAWMRCTTDVTARDDGGILLLRLNVASPEDLTDPQVAERLMQQLLRELYSHVPPTQVSLLRVRRD